MGLSQDESDRLRDAQFAIEADGTDCRMSLFRYIRMCEHDVQDVSLTADPDQSERWNIIIKCYAGTCWRIPSWSATDGWAALLKSPGAYWVYKFDDGRQFKGNPSH